MECIINIWGCMEIFPIHPLKSHLHFFNEMVYSFRHLPSNNRILGALWSNIAPGEHLFTAILLAHLGEKVHNLRHLPSNNSLLAAFR